MSTHATANSTPDSTPNTTPHSPATPSKDLRMHATTIARPRIARGRRFACAMASLAAIGVGALGAATPAVAEDCPNEQLRSENNSTRLPECRAYEMVTPLYKEGFPVERPTYSDDGGAIAYISLGNFADGALGGFNRYIATRSSAGWTTTSPYGPTATYDTDEDRLALSADLRSSLLLMHRGAEPADDGQFYYLRGPDGSFTRVGPVAVPGPDGGGAATQEASPDLTHVIFGHGAGSGAVEDSALYEFVGTGNEGPPRPVSVDNTGTPTTGETCSAGLGAGARNIPGMSADGRVIAFASECSGGVGFRLWARVGGSATVAVSRSECTRTSGDPGGACNALAPANFEGMSTDGSRVYFTTTQQLVNGDTDQTNDLYECEIPPGAPAPVGTANPCSSLTEVSGNVSGANVQSVVRVSEDGSRVYFIAKGVLATNLGTNAAAAVAGEENLYVWQKDAAHPAGQTTFVTKLESGIGIRPQTTTDGRYLVFVTSSRLLASDTDEAADVYRYDADTHGLLRLSTDSSGTGGNEPGFDVRLASPAPPITGTTPVKLKSAITSDAATVVFETAEQLSPADGNNAPDVYAWHDGQVSLISPGGAFGATALGITPSGQDIFFETARPLTAGDSGTEGDVYDARVGGGFDLSTPAPCSGEACQGSMTTQPQPPSASASAAFNGPGSPLTAEVPPASQPKPKPQTAAQKLAKALKACKAKHSRKKRKACEKRARNTYRRGK